MRHIICLLDINPDCLVKIFSFCSEKDLQNLCKVHWMLRQVIENNIFSIKTLDLLMCGRRNNPIIMQRTQYALSFGKRMEISKNWLNGCYREQQYFHRTKMFPTKLFLDKEWLYLSYACYISQHKRLKNEAVQRKYFHEISSKNNNDISDFTKKHESIFAGRVSGGCFIYEDECMTEQQLHCPKEYLWCVDFERNLYVTSTDHCSKIWRRSEEMGLLHLDLVSNLNGSYKALQFSNDGFRLYGGLYDSIIDRRALHEIDVESGAESILNSNTISIYDLKIKDENVLCCTCGAESILNSNTISIYDLKIKDENVLFTANFDTTFRMYDRRSNKDEHIWEDPFDSSFYCLEYDGLYAVLCGTKHHSRVNLYDIRVPSKHMQLYFPQSRDKRRREFRSSPVYSIACDSRYLFVATDRSVHVMDFKVNCGTCRDYSNINVFRQ